MYNPFLCLLIHLKGQLWTVVTTARLGSLGLLPMACASGCEGLWGVRWALKRLKGDRSQRNTSQKTEMPGGQSTSSGEV